MSYRFPVSTLVTLLVHINVYAIASYFIQSAVEVPFCANCFISVYWNLTVSCVPWCRCVLLGASCGANIADYVRWSKMGNI